MEGERPPEPPGITRLRLAGTLALHRTYVVFSLTV